MTRVMKFWKRDDWAMALRVSTMADSSDFARGS
jgi:hypothetical protein